MIYDKGVFGVILPFGLFIQGAGNVIKKYVGYANIDEISGSGVYSSSGNNLCFVKDFDIIKLYNPSTKQVVSSGNFPYSGEYLRPVVSGSLFKHYCDSAGIYYVSTFLSGVVSTYEMVNMPGQLVRSRDGLIFSCDSDYIYVRNSDGTWTQIIDWSDTYNPPSLIQYFGGQYYYCQDSGLFRGDIDFIGLSGTIYDFIIGPSESVVLTSYYLYYLDSSFTITHQVAHGGIIHSASQISLQPIFTAVNLNDKIVVFKDYSIFSEIPVGGQTIALLPNF